MKKLICLGLVALCFSCGMKKQQQQQPPAGAPGPQGPAGEQGPPGLNGTFITPVLPCPDLAGAFPEVLLCIDETLYAVYDGNGANKDVRYVELIPGNYVTTDGRGCNFTVIQNCEIQ
jgi:hypothetical protein